jgi:hypothetical protein
LIFRKARRCRLFLWISLGFIYEAIRAAIRDVNAAPLPLVDIAAPCLELRIEALGYHDRSDGVVPSLRFHPASPWGT